MHQGRNCESIQFSAGWDLDEGVSLKTLNTWNRKKRFGKGYADKEGDPFLEMNINMDGGLPLATFLDTLSWWATGVDKFTKHVGVE
jgi:hypothetical protein